VVGCASARAVYQHVSAAKLAHAEDVIRELAAEEGWSDKRLEILLANLHRKYREE
jgi:predicted transcriptional regulator